MTAAGRQRSAAAVSAFERLRGLMPQQAGAAPEQQPNSRQQEKAEQPEPEARRPLREAMPATAQLFADLRVTLGDAMVDALLRRTVAGQSGVYVAELAADGTVREFGRLADGRRCVDLGGVLRWVDRHGRPVPSAAELDLVPAELRRPVRAEWAGRVRA